MKETLNFLSSSIIIIALLCCYPVIKDADAEGNNSPVSSVNSKLPSKAAEVISRPTMRQLIQEYVDEVLKSKKHDKEKLRHIINAALNDGDMEVRASMASAIGSLGDKEIITELLEAFNDEEMWVRLAAAAGLGNINDKEVIPKLLDLLEDNDAHIREASALALGLMDYKGEIPGLNMAIEEKKIDQRIAAYLLGDAENLDQKEFKDLKQKLENKADIYSRIVAVLAFGKIGKINNEKIVMLRKRLTDEEPIVRALTVVVLSRLQDKKSLQEIEHLINDEDALVRGVVSLAMGKLGQEKTLKGLESMSTDKVESVRASAALSIGVLGDVTGIPILETLLFDQNDGFAVKLMSVASLWKLTD